MKKYSFRVQVVAEIEDVTVLAENEEEAQQKILKKDLVDIIPMGRIDTSDVTFLEETSSPEFIVVSHSQLFEGDEGDMEASAFMEELKEDEDVDENSIEMYWSQAECGYKVSWETLEKAAVENEDESSEEE